ncbi:myrosinase 1-like isoform X2 [Phymastichus coffea]|uniref:myrosinase 1-like isoform X2 n=1 Tax=Phymastichus coffea TaxID=108790 RepID=UPI00273BF139|nr:myrosinase 1-like isoform X2 [Phymastichus coffea]
MNWQISPLTVINFVTNLMNILFPTNFSSDMLLQMNVNIVERKISMKDFDFPMESMEVARALALNRFPDKFLFGAGSSAYQIEGAYDADGLSVWDFWTHNDASPIVDKSNGDVACDSYHKYAEDVNLVKNLGGNTYRISLSWSRILPHGLSHFVNIQGIKYYNNLINTMILNGVTPMVTMHYYDVPVKLQLMGGWTNPQMVKYFEDYARVAFNYFGDRVKHWITFNDPFDLCNIHFGNAYKPWYNDSAVGNYLCGHHVLLAHARVYHLYRTEFHWLQKGKVGISIGTQWFEPKDPTSLDDVEATELSFQFGTYWFLNPLLGELGDYPDLMKVEVEIKSALQRYQTSRLPSFTLDEKQMIKQSLDFLGINFFTSFYVQSIADDVEIIYHYDSVIRNESVWNDMRSQWIFFDKSTPENFAKLLQRLNKDYILPQVYITANGFIDKGNIYDVDRALYHVNHLIELFVKMFDGIDVRAYIAWSLLDEFQWMDGYTQKMGLYSVDFEDPERPRSEKFSATILKSIYKSKTVTKITEQLLQS